MVPCVGVVHVCPHCFLHVLQEWKILRPQGDRVVDPPSVAGSNEVFFGNKKEEEEEEEKEEEEKKKEWKKKKKKKKKTKTKENLKCKLCIVEKDSSK